MKQIIKLTLPIICLLWATTPIIAHKTGYVHADGKEVHDTEGNNLIMRSIGTGNWMLQEGYMMQTADVANTQWRFRERLTDIIGKEKTAEFYTHWLDNHFTKKDVVAMKNWGFNTVRPALHYKWFTPSIEDEPIKGQQTWIEDGFRRLDDLLKWCAESEIYVVLDMHGCPGGQGKDAAISDYDDSKPSLWESPDNQEKLVALWREIARRHSNNPWVAGYDLINETNWPLPGGTALKNIYLRLTKAIREVDTQHMLIIEGNDWSNNYTGLTPAWEENMCYSFHKYWTYNDQNAISFATSLRESTNRPIWLGETGENSNSWFTDCISLMETNNIGWSFWPVKKSGINNVLRVITNKEYTDLINYWKNGGTPPSATQAFNAVMGYSEAHKIANCVVQQDVIDAMIRQPRQQDTKPFKPHTEKSIIYAVDYDLGASGQAYWDRDSANYHLNTSQYVNWNKGWAYRNDGVDIEACSDPSSNGYAVGWTEDNEWMQYTLTNSEQAAYTLSLRYAANNNGTIAYVKVNGVRATRDIPIPTSGGWNTWKEVNIPNIILPKGEVKLQLVFVKGGANLASFRFTKFMEEANAPFIMLNAETARVENTVHLNLNKPITSLSGNPFEVQLNGATATIELTEPNPTNPYQAHLHIKEVVLDNSTLTVSCKSGTECISDKKPLSTFNAYTVVNKVAPVLKNGSRIEIEEYAQGNTFTFEECKDTDGGLNTSHIEKGRMAEYLLYADRNGRYTFRFRVAGTSDGTMLILRKEADRLVAVNPITLRSTGGWQTWTTQSVSAELPQGKYIIRLYANSSGYNLNWMELSYEGASNINSTTIHPAKIFPNPAREELTIQCTTDAPRHISVMDMLGVTHLSVTTELAVEQLDVRTLHPGTYLLRIMENNSHQTHKVNIQ